MEDYSYGWDHPVKKADNGESVKKSEIKWTVEDKLANSKSKALNIIFNTVDANQFKLISTCETEKEAWEIFQTAHEGTDTIKLSKPHNLTTGFQNLKMKEKESISELNARLCDIVNEAFTLGEN